MGNEIGNPAVQTYDSRSRLVAAVTFGGDATGTASATTATTMTHTGATFGTTQYVGKTVFMQGKSAVIVSHTDEVLTFASWVGGNPTADVYIIGAADIVGPIGTHRIFEGSTAVTLVRAIVPWVAGGLSGATATISLGTTEVVDKFIAATTATNLATDEVWQDATPDAKAEALVAACTNIVVLATDIVLAIATKPITSGGISIAVLSDPLIPDAELAIATGTSVVSV